MSKYDPDVFRSLYARYIKSPKEELLGDMLLSLNGLIDSIIYGRFSTVRVLSFEDMKQEVYVYLIPFIRNKSVCLDRGFTSFIYRCVYHRLVNLLKQEPVHDTISFDEGIGVDLEDPHCDSRRSLTKEILNTVKKELYRVHELFRVEEGKDVCRFISHYYVGKKLMPSLRLVQEKFPKNENLDAIYPIAVAEIRSKVVQLRKVYRL